MPKLPDHPALLIIDVQEGSFTIPGFEIAQAEDFLSTIAMLAERARTNGVPVVYTQFLSPPETPMGPGMPGSQIRASVEPQLGDIVVPKNESDSFLNSGLKSELDRLGVRSVLVCGLQTEFCVDATCRTAYALGYKVMLVEDAHTTSDSETLRAAQIVQHHNATLGRAYVSLVRAAKLF